jgi:hypothetical protein
VAYDLAELHWLRSGKDDGPSNFLSCTQVYTFACFRAKHQDRGRAVPLKLPCHAALHRSVARIDGRHDLEMLKSRVPGMGGPKRGAGSMEDIGDFKRGSHRLGRRAVALAGIRCCIWMRPVKRRFTSGDDKA